MSKTFKVHAVENRFLRHQRNNFANIANSRKELDTLIFIVKSIKFLLVTVLLENI